MNAFGGLWHSSKKFDRVGWMIFAVEYAWPEKLHYTRAAERSFDLLLAELAALDMNIAVPKVDIPIYFAVGRYDQMAPFELSQDYFATHYRRRTRSGFGSSTPLIFRNGRRWQSSMSC